MGTKPIALFFSFVFRFIRSVKTKMEFQEAGVVPGIDHRTEGAKAALYTSTSHTRTPTGSK